MDFANAQLSLPVRGYTLSLYVWQPQLRVENQSFVLGRTGSVGPGGTMQYDATTRETRGGVAVAKGEGVRWGAAFEMTSRDDEYQVLETSARPTRDCATSRGRATPSAARPASAGSAVRLERGGLVLGAGLHVQAPLSVSGTESARLTSGQLAAGLRRRARLDVGGRCVRPLDARRSPACTPQARSAAPRSGTRSA